MPPSTSAPSVAAAEWVGAALGRRGFLVSVWPWRSLAYLATTLGVLVVLLLPVMAALAPLLAAVDSPDGASVWAGVAGSLLPVAVVLVLVAPMVARVDLARARLVDRRGLPRVAEPSGFVARWRYRLTHRSAWLRVVHVATLVTAGAVSLGVVLIAVVASFTLLSAPVLVGAVEEGISLGPWTISTSTQAWLALPLAVPALAGTAYLGGAVAAGHVLLTRLLLVDPAARFEEQVGQLTRSRARLVHSFDAERRRIERDLHDVAQQRVVALTMELGLAELDLTEELGADHASTRSVAAAHEHATRLMAELRGLIHGIHPQVLTDLGVGAAVDQLAATMPMRVEVHDELGHRPATHVESTLYLCLNEALTNAARHSGAETVDIVLRRADGSVVAEIRDDGHGGADPALGTGLSGMADRAAVLNGTVTISSPPGGPTVLRIAVPDDPDYPEESP